MYFGLYFERKKDNATVFPLSVTNGQRPIPFSNGVLYVTADLLFRLLFSVRQGGIVGESEKQMSTEHLLGSTYVVSLLLLFALRKKNIQNLKLKFLQNVSVLDICTVFKIASEVINIKLLY